METLTLFGVFIGILIMFAIVERIREYIEKERSRQRDEIAVNVIAEYGISNEDKSDLLAKLDYVVSNVHGRVPETEPYEISIPNKVSRRAGERCPKCNVGYLVRRQGRYGGYFLGCSNYPYCTGKGSETVSNKWARTVQKNRIAKEFLKDFEKAYK